MDHTAAVERVQQTMATNRTVLIGRLVQRMIELRDEVEAGTITGDDLVSAVKDAEREFSSDYTTFARCDAGRFSEQQQARQIATSIEHVIEVLKSTTSMLRDAAEDNVSGLGAEIAIVADFVAALGDAISHEGSAPTAEIGRRLRHDLQLVFDSYLSRFVDQPGDLAE
jgi:hypothetical protein